MNREILFRAKRVDNGEWVDGYYVYDTEWAQAYIYRLVHTGIYYELRKVEVKIETVGQFTGLFHKKTRKIFQDDIFLEETELDEGDIHIPFIVTWITEKASFALLSVSERIAYEDNGIFGIEDSFDGFRVEIYSLDFDKMIYKGNIHDNPELLK